MKLISAYITGYGKIKNRRIDFDKSITEICENNGFGKTTISSFIKAMFYGLDSYKANTSLFSERQHFYPFDNGLFGGNLTFEYQKNIYRIERTFGEKSETKDTFALYCNDNLSTQFTKNIGRELFSLDKPSFERLLFITSDDIEIESTNSISMKLNNLVEGSENFDFDSIISKLSDVQKNYKSTGKNSLLANALLTQKTLQNEIDNLQGIENTLENKYRKQQILFDEISDLQQKVNKASELNTLHEKWNRYEDYISKEKEKQEELKTIEDKYPNGLPERAYVDEIQGLNQKVLERTTRMNQLNFTQKDEDELIKYKDIFKEDIPSSDKLNEIQSIIKENAHISGQLSGFKEVTRQKDKELIERFSHKTPTEETFSDLEEITAQYKTAVDKKSTTSPTISKMNHPIKEKKNTMYIILGILAVVLMIGSIPLFLVNTILAGVILGVGGFVLLVDGFMYLNRKTSSQGMAIPEENPEYSSLIRQITELEGKFYHLVIPFGYDNSLGIETVRTQLVNDYKDYLDLKKSMEDENNKNKDLIQKIQKNEKTIHEFFQMYQCDSDNLDASLATLNVQINSYHVLRDKKQDIQKKIQEEEKQLKSELDSIQERCDIYKIDSTNLADEIDRVKKDLFMVQTIRSNLEKLKKEKEDYKTDNHLTEKPQEEIIDIQEENQKISDLNKEKAILDKEIEAYEQDLSKLGEYKNTLEKLREKITEYKSRFQLIELTIQELKNADQKLLDKYVGPVKNKFVEYSKILEETLGENVVMNKKYEITFEKEGIQRSDKHLSSGMRSICTLCFRLALLDNMEDMDKPFIIMDDPFDKLDEEHLEKVRKLIHKISKDMQILYFTCHPSRKIL